MRMLEMRIIFFLFYTGDVCSETFLRKCQTGNGFKFLFNRSLETCIDECLRRRRCKGIIYAREMNYCELVDNFNVDIIPVEQPTCTYTDIQDIDLSATIEGECAFRPCGDNERCLSHGTRPKKYYCETLECPALEDRANARALSNKFEIGTKNVYKCNSGYSLSGNSTFECLANGTWSVPQFECRKMCTFPQKTYANANLTMIISHNRFSVNTTADFRCDDSFTELGNTFTAVCGDDGNWWPSTVRCVKNGSHVVNGQSSRRIYNEGLQPYRSEMIRYCKDAGGRMVNPLPDLISPLNKDAAFRYLSLVTTKSSLSTYSGYNLTYCLEAELGNVTVFLNYSYDQLVDAVRMNNLQNASTPQCSTVLKWGLNEPGGLDTDNCILADSNDNYRWNDVACRQSMSYGQTGFICQFDMPSLPEWSE